MAATSAVQATFDITELLENILVHLPPKRIFLVQRVNKRFHDLMAKSPSIQHKLFLRLEDKPRELWTETSHPARSEPFFVKWTPREIQRQVDRAKELAVPFDYSYPRRTVTPALLNPIYKRKFPPGTPFQAMKAWTEGGQQIVLDLFNKPELQNKRGIDMSKLIPLAQKLSIGTARFCNPPRKSVVVCLYLVVPGTPLITLEMTRVVVGEKAATLDSVIAAALAQTGPIVCHRDGSGPSEQYWPSATTAIETCERQAGAKACIYFPKCTIRLCGVVIPTDEERADAEAQMARPDGF